MARAEVINTTELSGARVMFGARVQLVDEETEAEVTYQIVSEYEADLDNGMISHTSPIARALISKEQGDSVEVAAPRGKRYYEILEVVYE